MDQSKKYYRRAVQSLYLCLDAVQTSEPQDLASPQFHLSMVDFVSILCQLLFMDLLFCDAMSCLLQEFQVMCRDGCDQLSLIEKKIN